MGEQLEPVDSQRCQAEKKGGNFMTFGPRPLIRCKNKPTWIAVEIKEGVFYGAMSLCGKCKKICEIQMPTVQYQSLK